MRGKKKNIKRAIIFGVGSTKMSIGGIILIHDYFMEIYPNIEEAVRHFEKEIGFRLYKMPIGDDISLTIMRTWRLGKELLEF